MAYTLSPRNQCSWSPILGPGKQLGSHTWTLTQKLFKIILVALRHWKIPYIGPLVRSVFCETFRYWQHLDLLPGMVHHTHLGPLRWYHPHNTTPKPTAGNTALWVARKSTSLKRVISELAVQNLENTTTSVSQGTKIPTPHCQCWLELKKLHGHYTKESIWNKRQHSLSNQHSRTHDQEKHIY